MTNEKKEKELYIFQRGINIIIQKVFNFSIIGNNKQQSQIEKLRNIPESYPINNEIINSEKLNGEVYNLYPEKYNKIQTIIENKQNSFINNSSIKNYHNIKFKYFDIKKSKIEKQILDLKTNNEIKVLKNNKVVYINKDLLNSYSTSRVAKKFKKINFIIRKKNSSKYRGVSKNGSKWQVLIMVNLKKYYLGSYPSEELAARIYDIQAIKSWGVKAKTNFVYNNNQIKKIYNQKINIKCNNISEIMDQINN